jgi:hypothetical protein
MTVPPSGAGVSTYARHPDFPGDGTLPTDPAARWLASRPTAFVPMGNPVITSARSTTAFYKAIVVPVHAAAAGNATLAFAADDTVNVIVNGRLVGPPAAPFPGLTSVQFPLRPGPNLIVLQCSATGQLPLVVAALAAADGTALARTDATWAWL